MKKIWKKNRKGAVSAFLLAVGVIVAILGLSTLSLGLQARLNAIRLAREIIAKIAADAGLSKAIYEFQQTSNKNKNLLAASKESISYSDSLSSLNIHSNIVDISADAVSSKALYDFENTSDKKKLLAASNQTIPYFDGKFSYAVTSDQAGGYTIISTGQFGNTQKTVECKLQQGGSPFEYAVFSDNGIKMSNSAKIDWYNNNKTDPPLQVGTNSTKSNKITLSNNSIINGNINIGAGGNPATVIKTTNSAKITGTKKTLPSEKELESVSVPSTLTNAPSGGNITGTTTISSSGKYNDIKLSNNKTLTIKGDVELYLTGNISLSNNTQIQIAPDSSVKIYLAGDLKTSNSGKINNRTKKPENLQIYGLDSSSSIKLSNNSDIYGVIYAPNADLKLSNSAEIYGGTVSKSITLSNNTKIMFDASLRNESGFKVGGGGLKISAWREY